MVSLRTSLAPVSLTMWLGMLIPSALVSGVPARAQSFYPLKDVHAGLRGVGRTIFQGNRIEDFQVEILGVLQNAGPKQSIILARLSGGPLAQAGVIQGMSGSPVYVDGKLLGAIALGFAFSKEPIAGIQPIEQMISDARFNSSGPSDAHVPNLLARPGVPVGTLGASLGGSLTQILTPVAMTGFTPATLQAFASQFHKLGFEPQQGVSSGSPTSQNLSGTVTPGSMISVQLLSGDMSVSADGTVTYIDGKHVYAFGHRFLDAGSIEMPFARSEVIAVLPTLNTSFKLSTPKEWVGSIVSDRSTSVAGEIGRRARTIPATISVHAVGAASREYRVRVVNDRLLTPFISQLAIFSAIDATERTLGAGTLRLREKINFEGTVPPLVLRDIFVGDGGVAQQVATDAVVTLAFVLGAGLDSVRIKDMTFDLEPVESKRQLYISQAWTSAHQVRPGDSVTITALFAGQNGVQLTRSAAYHVPVGAANGQLNFTISDANTLNFPEFAGMNAASTANPTELIELINKYRGSESAYIRVWRSEPSFTVAGPSPGGELTDPPPSIMLILADPSSTPTSNPAQLTTRGSGIAELTIPVDGYVVSGAKTVQVEVKE